MKELAAENTLRARVLLGKFIQLSIISIDDDGLLSGPQSEDGGEASHTHLLTAAPDFLPGQSR